MANLKLESEEYQSTLRAVLKSEIQFLLERLSQTGEETVVLTANMGESCTGHLASPNAEGFVGLDDIGKLKNKFLYFLKGASKASARPETKTAIITSVPNRVSPGSGTDALKQSTTQNPPAVKRPLGSVSPSGAAGPATKTRKIEPEKPVAGLVALVTGPKPRPPLPGLPSDSTKLGIKAIDVKLSTTKVVSKSGGFTEERLSDAEFKKILQHVNNGDSDHDDDEEDEEDEEEYSEEEYDGGHLEEGEIRFPQPNFMKMNTFQTPKPGQPVSATGIKPGTLVAVHSNLKAPTVPLSQQGKSGEAKCDSSENKSAADKTGGACGSKADGGPGRRQNVLAGGKDGRIGDPGIKINPIQMPEIKEEADPLDLEYKKGQEKAKMGCSKDDKGKLEAKTEDKKGAASAPTPHKPGQPQPKAERVPITDDMDTETLIKLTKAARKENMSEVDQAIEAKLGQLSSKLSWIVEYPKDSAGPKMSQQQQHQQQQQQSMQDDDDCPPYMEGEEEDDEEEDYNEEEEDLDNVNEDELDDEDKAVYREYKKKQDELRHQKELALYRQQAGMVPGYQLGIEGQYDEEGEEEYNEDDLEEMDEEEYEEYGDYMADDESNVLGPGMVQLGQHGLPLQQASFMVHMNEALPIQGNNFGRPTSPSMENFLLMGPILAKCLVCNKIVRKTEVKQHNQLHIAEMNAAEDEVGEEEGEGGEEHVGDEMPEDGDEEEGDYGDYNEAEGDGDGEGEFVAEKFVAEKVSVEGMTNDDKSLSKEINIFVCDLCNKTFKSATNLQRHKRIHENSVTQCPVCSKSFKLNAYMLKHLKKLHPEYRESDGDVKGAKAAL